ncbi:hypothetical protein CNR27_00695 [Luteimonas chenhongjianii]|uniref:VanZ-like domain-containing protein n=1 Tax=Luteimonas chenhongjianii TaxID=2006110 RepID=A0A290XAQ4_9GAMM|nr:hypothetical protein [Luteimonas chenhongjianii]ATD66153.1 hypothetical protein CNR27_00695 [Luteimonas chenhongjianii]
MTAAELLLAVMAIALAVLLARGSHPAIACMLVASALAVSALLFLPTGMLGDWVGMDHVHRLYALTRTTPLDPPEWIHVIAFAWLGLLIWVGRAGLRGWPGLLLIACLGIGAELAQWLADGREAGFGDAAFNVAGGVCGVLIAVAARYLLKHGQARPPAR